MLRMILIPEDDYKTLQDRLNKIGEKGYMLEDIYFTRLFKFSKTDKPVHYLVDFNLEEFKKKRMAGTIKITSSSSTSLQQRKIVL